MILEESGCRVGLIGKNHEIMLKAISRAVCWMAVLGFFSATLWAIEPILFQELSTPRGLKALFLGNHNTPTIKLLIGFKKSGYDDDLIENRGLLSVLVAQILQEGIEQHTQALKLKGIKFQFGDVFFNKEHFCFQLESPTEQLEKALTLLCDYLYHLRISLHEYPIYKFQKILKAHKAETQVALKTLVEPDTKFLAQYTLYQLISGQHLFSPAKILSEILTGTERLSLRDVTDYIQHHFTQENLIISVAGNIQPDRLIQAIDATLGRLPMKSSQLAVNLPSRKLSQKVQKQYIFKDMPDSIICFGQPWIAQPYYVRNPLEMMLDRLIKLRLKNDGKVNNTNHPNLYPEINLGQSLITGCLHIDNTAVPKRITQIKEFFKEVKTGGFDSKYLENLQKGLTHEINQKLDEYKKKSIKSEVSFLRKIKSDNTIAVYYLFNQQTKAISCFMSDPLKVISQLKKIQLKDLDTIARSMLDPDQLSWVEIGRENHLNHSNDPGPS